MTPGQELYETYKSEFCTVEPFHEWVKLSTRYQELWHQFATRVQPANPWVCMTDRQPPEQTMTVEVYFADTCDLTTRIAAHLPNCATCFWRRFTPPAPKDPFEEWWQTNGKQQNCDAAMKALAKDAWNAALNHLGKEKA